MFSYQHCLDLVIDYLKPGSTDPEDDYVILTTYTIEKPYCFIFFYNSRIFIEAGNVSHALAGNGPLFISKLDGSLSRYMTGLSEEEMIDLYEEERRIWSLYLSASVYHDIKKLSSLKNVMAWSLEQLSFSKKENITELHSGSLRKAEELKCLLEAENIETTIVLDPIYVVADK